MDLFTTNFFIRQLFYMTLILLLLLLIHEKLHTKHISEK